MYVLAFKGSGFERGLKCIYPADFSNDTNPSFNVLSYCDRSECLLEERFIIVFVHLSFVGTISSLIMSGTLKVVENE